MTTGNPTPRGSSPADDIQRSFNTVTGALKAAGENVMTSNQEIGLCAIKQAEENVSLLFNTLRDIAGSKSPSDAASPPSVNTTSPAISCCPDLM